MLAVGSRFRPSSAVSAASAAVSAATFEPLPPRAQVARRYPANGNRDQPLRKLVLVHQLAKRVTAAREEVSNVLINLSMIMISL